MLLVSYATAATAMFAAALYLFFRLRLFLTTGVITKGKQIAGTQDLSPSDASETLA